MYGPIVFSRSTVSLTSSMVRLRTPFEFMYAIALCTRAASMQRGRLRSKVYHDTPLRSPDEPASITRNAGAESRVKGEDLKSSPLKLSKNV